ncbi:MAG: translation initiation factor IF-2 N-terminal domain-containing protein, partial [Clostridiales bacterium]|nr:translation initiation factor IF-2 N-terminal domain-containing protein [Clostridiales bacterium]
MLMDNATTNNVNTVTEDAATNIKRLYSLVESSDLQSFIKRIADTKRRVEKLFASERSRLSELTAERVRKEQEAEQAEREAARAAVEPEPEKLEPIVAAEHVDQPQESVPEPEQLSHDDNSIVAPESTAAKPAEPQKDASSGTRTAIPSYIRGVIKHTPRPAPETRPQRSDRGSAPRPAQDRSPRGGNGTMRPASPRLGGGASRPSVINFEPPAAQRNKRDVAGKKSSVKPEDKKQMNKRTLIRKGYIQENVDEERMGTRKLKNKKVNKVVPFAPIKIENAVITTENLTVKILSEKIGKTAQEIIKQLMELGIMTNIN